MKEADKGWKRSAKLQSAIVAFAVILLIYLDNRHNIVLADHVVSVCELAIVGALGGRIGMGITQSIVGGATQEAQTLIQKFDPKDIDGLPE